MNYVSVCLTHSSVCLPCAVVLDRLGFHTSFISGFLDCVGGTLQACLPIINSRRVMMHPAGCELEVSISGVMYPSLARHRVTV